MNSKVVLRLVLSGAIICVFTVDAEAQVPRPGAINGVLDRATELPTMPTQQGGGLLSTIFGCSANGHTQEIGAAVGGVAGGLLGNRVAGRGSRTIGTVIGAAVGAAAGSALGCKLQRDDQIQAEAALTRSANTGQTQSWINQSSGASGSTRIVDNRSQGLPGLALAPGVQPTTGYRVVDGYYTSANRANIRSAPHLSSTILGQLALNERVWVPAAISSGDWLLVSKDGIGQGYVSSALLTPATAATTNCKIVQQTIIVRGETETQDLQACRNPAGGWTFNTMAS